LEGLCPYVCEQAFKDLVQRKVGPGTTTNWEISSLGIIATYGTCEEQTKHIDVVYPLHQGTVMLTKSKATIEYMPMPASIAITKMDDLVKWGRPIWRKKCPIMNKLKKVLRDDFVMQELLAKFGNVLIDNKHIETTDKVQLNKEHPIGTVTVIPGW
jgi:hypothetical protein